MEFIISGSILFISTNPGENTTSIFSLGCLVSQLQIANNANTTIKCFILLGVSWGFDSIKRSCLCSDAAQLGREDTKTTHHVDEICGSAGGKPIHAKLAL